VLRGICDQGRFTRTDDLARNSAIRRKAKRLEPSRDFSVASYSDGKIELVGLPVEQKERRPFGGEKVRALLHDRRDQLVQLDLRGEGTGQLIQELETRESCRHG